MVVENGITSKIEEPEHLFFNNEQSDDGENTIVCMFCNLGRYSPMMGILTIGIKIVESEHLCNIR